MATSRSRPIAPPPPAPATPHEVGMQLAWSGATQGAGGGAMALPTAARLSFSTGWLPKTQKGRSLAATGLMGVGGLLGTAQGYLGGQIGARIAPNANIRDQSTLGHAALYAAPFALLPPVAIAAGVAGAVAGVGTGLAAEAYADPQIEKVSQAPRTSDVLRGWCVYSLAIGAGQQ
jgi:hypothetical protein